MKTDKRILSTCRIVLALGIWSLVMTSCGNENKSISEPLSLDERNELIKKDIEYGMVFSMLDALEKRHSPLTASEKATMDDLSYKRLKDFLSVCLNTTELDQQEERYGAEWEKEYGSVNAKVDSIDHHWQHFLEDYQTDNYLKIELVDILDKSNVFLGYVKVRLRLIPLKGKVDKVEAYYGLQGSMMGRNQLTVDKPFSSPIEVDNSMSFNYAFDIKASKVNDLPIKELLDEYGLKTNITQLTVNGRKIDYIDGYNQAPDCVREMWKYRMKYENEWEGSYFKESSYNRIAKELINPSMPTKDDYVKECIRKDAYNEDELAATFYYEIMI